MNFNQIDIQSENLNPFKKIGKDWYLITAGDENNYNTMTASWGFMGYMWNKNVVTIVVRPQRYTMDFIKKNDKFTLSFFDEAQKDVLKFCGTNSGRDVNKAEATGIEPIAIEDSVTFKQAKQVFVCKKLYAQPLEEDCFIDKSLLSNYTNGDFHIAIVAEVEKIFDIVNFIGKIPPVSLSHIG